jgi:hypothetical protein
MNVLINHMSTDIYKFSNQYFSLKISKIHIGYIVCWLSYYKKLINTKCELAYVTFEPLNSINHGEVLHVKAIPYTH